ncbi:MAG: phosphoenolpyruvate carboxykinase (ATP) [Bacteroidales bacterium]|nr:phosphoenolpyruvate carboxykinase (ATP) [Bacteroidales bacterium]
MPELSPAHVPPIPAPIHRDCSAAELLEFAVRRGEGGFCEMGALACRTGSRTGRSPRDKFIVSGPLTDAEVAWGKVNQRMPAEQFERLTDRVRAYLQNRELFTFHGFAAAHPTHRIRLQLQSESAWHVLFARCLFLREDPRHENHPPDDTGDWEILHAPYFLCDPRRDGTNSEAVIALSFEQRRVLIAGTQYAGEIKKSVFSILNFLLPQAGVLSMHCSANIGPAGDVALFFGLSGTGKTTLSADPARRLIGDDEHGWGDEGVFNIEGGCYAKTIRLSPEGEPQIWNAIRFGSVLENVPVDAHTRRANFDSEEYTENTRVAYPIDFIPHAELSGRGGHPQNVFFLTCDAYGVLPPISRLTPEQVVDYFLCGYTAKVAGTEAGVTEPSATFSTCFAAPFLPLAPRRYAAMLKEKLARHNVPVWLVNTGWTGGPYGTGQRMSLVHTRALLSAALDGGLNAVECVPDPVFGLAVPRACPGVPAEILQPRQTWSDPAAYDQKAAQLARLFTETRAQYG